MQCLHLPVSLLHTRTQGVPSRSDEVSVVEGECGEQVRVRARNDKGGAALEGRPPVLWWVGEVCIYGISCSMMTW